MLERGYLGLKFTVERLDTSVDEMGWSVVERMVRMVPPEDGLDIEQEAEDNVWRIKGQCTTVEVTGEMPKSFPADFVISVERIRNGLNKSRMRLLSVYYSMVRGAFPSSHQSCSTTTITLA